MAVPRSIAPKSLAAISIALALLVGACSPSNSATTTTAEPGGTNPPTTTTEAPATTETQPPTSIPGSASESLDPSVVEKVRDEVAELIITSEEVRGLPFLETPTVTILDESEFTQRVADLVAEDLDEAELAIDTAFFAMLGMLAPGTDLYDLLIDLYSEQVAGFYDGDTKELVVPATSDGFSALQRITVVHELIHALTDQHFDFNDEYERRNDDGNGDDASALAALVEGDATYFQYVYLEGLSPLETLQATTEALGIDSSSLENSPAWLQADLLFPYDEGLTFLAAIVDAGGLALVDRSYTEPPTTTEQILHPEKYSRLEAPVTLPPLTVDLEGWDLHDDGTFGEWGLRLLLMETLTPGDVTQAAAGWGNDQLKVFSDGDDVAMVMHYVGDSEADAEDLVNALIALARGPMNAGPAVESGGGLLYDQNGVYLFLDRIEDEAFWIVSTDQAAGADLRDQLGL